MLTVSFLTPCSGQKTFSLSGHCPSLRCCMFFCYKNTNNVKAYEYRANGPNDENAKTTRVSMENSSIANRSFLVGFCRVLSMKEYSNVCLLWVIDHISDPSSLTMLGQYQKCLSTLVIKVLTRLVKWWYWFMAITFTINEGELLLPSAKPSAFYLRSWASL